MATLRFEWLKTCRSFLPIIIAWILTSASVEAQTLPAGSPAKWTGNPPSLLTVESSAFDNVFFPEEEKTVVVVIQNPKSEAIDGEVDVSITTEDGQQQHMTLPVKIPASGTLRLPVRLNLSQPCFADCIFSLAGQSASFRTTVSVVRPPQVKNISLQDAMYGVCQGYHPRTFQRIGARFFREFIYWKWTEKTPGNYDFGYALPLDRDCCDAGLGVIWTLEPNLPSWLGLKQMVLLNEPESLTHFGDWAQAAVKALTLAPHAFEINNEPDLTMGRSGLVSEDEAAAAIAALLRRGYQVVKKTDPSIPVLGSGVSGSAAMVPNNLPEKILTDAQGDIDYYSPHPYVGGGSQYISPDGAVTWPDQYLGPLLQKNAELAVKYTQGKALWSTEGGWAYPVNDVFLSSSTRDYASICAQAMVIYKTVPHVGKMTWFRGYQYQQGLNERGYDYSMFLQAPGGMRPTPAVNAYATTSSLLEGARLGTKLELGPALRGFLFENPLTHQAIAAMWTTRYDVSPTVAPPDPITVVDLYGRKVPSGSHWVLTRSLSFLETDLDHEMDLKSYLSGQTWRPKRLFLVSGVGATSTSSLNLTVENLFPTDLATKVTSGPQHAEAILHPGVNALSLPLSDDFWKEQSLHVPLSITGGDSSEQAIIDKQIIQVPYVAPGMFAPDGNVSPEKMSLAAHLLDQRANIFPTDPSIPWRGPQDLSVHFGYAWNEQGLYVLVMAKDDKHVAAGPTSRSLWNFDSLQIAMEPNGAGGYEGFQPGDHEVDVALDTSGNTSVVQSYPPKDDPPEITAKVSRQDPQTIYELMIPWKYVYASTTAPSANTVLGFNFIVNDNDGSGRKCWMGVVDGIGAGRQPARYPWLRLMPPSPVRH